MRYKDSMRSVLLAFMLTVAISVPAEQRYSWAIATFNAETQDVSIAEYTTKCEQAPDGNTYNRIVLDTHGSAENRYETTKYGFVENDGKVYVYDFDTAKKHVAIDYNLQSGDTFTSINGEKWQVEVSSDTLICDYNHTGVIYEKRHKMLKVINTDDGREDTWLEGLGSMSNHLMTEKPRTGIHSEMLWIYNEEQYYIARELSADPLFGHDTGWLSGTYSNDKEDEVFTTVTYQNNVLTITDSRLWYPSRHYTYYYRAGDNIYAKAVWEFLPHIDAAQDMVLCDTFSIHGIPAPASGAYTVHLTGGTATTGIYRTYNEYKTTDHPIFDINGHLLPTKPQNGIYIQNGRKIRR